MGLGKIQFPHTSPRRISKALLIAKNPSPFLCCSETGEKEAAGDSAPNSHLNLISGLIWEIMWKKKRKGFYPGMQTELLTYNNHPLPVLSLELVLYPGQQELGALEMQILILNVHNAGDSPWQMGGDMREHLCLGAVCFPYQY